MTPDMPAMDEKGQALKDIEACLDEAVSYLVDLAGAKPDKHSPNNCRVKIDEARFYARHLASLKAVPEVEAVDAFEICAKVAEGHADLVEEMRGIYPGDPHGALGRDANKMRKLAKAIRALRPQPSPDADGAKGC